MLMARRDRAYGAGDTLIDARDRVDAATAERSRLSGERNSANGTSRELETEARLCAASDEVTARERWLHWVEDGDY